MQFDLDTATPLLKRTPRVLDTLLRDLPHAWIGADEGENTWSPLDVMGHLVHGERTDWMERTRMILECGESESFAPFDRFAQFEESRGQRLEDLLDTFADLRAGNLAELGAMALTAQDLARTGTHPAFGPVTLEQLLATWVVHDLGHLRQITRVMAKQYGEAAGPWRQYLPVLSE